VFSSGVFSKTVDWICEDYSRVEDGGNTIVTRQYSKKISDGSVISQYLVGHRAGSAPPSKHHKHHKHH
jgi:hypothetical protein